MAETKQLEGYPRRDASLPLWTRVRLGLTVFLVVAGLLLGGSYLLLRNPEPGSQVLQAATPSPQATADDSLKQLRATEDAILTTYGWVDKQNGVVRIPIDRAMDLLLQRGLPARK